MGILDVFKRKKEDPLATEFPGQWQDPATQAYPPIEQPMDSQGFGQQPGMYPQQQAYPAYPQDQQAGFSPEQAGFERIRESYPSRGGQNVSDINMAKDLELINAKLDAIKSELDSINQRIKRIERFGEPEQQQGKRDPWY